MKRFDEIKTGDKFYFENSDIAYTKTHRTQAAANDNCIATVQPDRTVFPVVEPPKQTGMKLHEIIEANEVPDQSILIESLMPYKKLLLTYYSDAFCDRDPMLMVTDVFNAAQYGKIINPDELLEAIGDYLSDSYLSDEDRANAIEEIMFNSVFLENL